MSVQCTFIEIAIDPDQRRIQAWLYLGLGPCRFKKRRFTNATCGSYALIVASRLRYSVCVPPTCRSKHAMFDS